MLAMRTLVAVIGLLALAACGGTAVPLPPPVEGNLTGAYSGTSRITASATIFNFVVYDRPVSLSADVVDAAGTLTGSATVTVEGEPPFTAGFSGSNTAGRVAATLSFQACGQTIDLQLEGTVNPANTINFSASGRSVNCDGQSGTVRLEAFRLVRTS